MGKRLPTLPKCTRTSDCRVLQASSRKRYNQLLSPAHFYLHRTTLVTCRSACLHCENSQRASSTWPRAIPKELLVGRRVGHSDGCKYGQTPPM